MAVHNFVKQFLNLFLAVLNIAVNTANVRGRTPPRGAANQGHHEVMELELAVPNIALKNADNDGWTLPHEIANNGHLAVNYFPLSSNRR